jgi:hypothetical protein
MTRHRSLSRKCPVSGHLFGLTLAELPGILREARPLRHNQNSFQLSLLIVAVAAGLASPCAEELPARIGVAAGFGVLAAACTFAITWRV